MMEEAFGDSGNFYMFFHSLLTTFIFLILFASWNRLSIIDKKSKGIMIKVDIEMSTMCFI